MTGADRSSGRARGQPLLVLAAVLGGWLGLRVLLWQSPFPLELPVPTFAEPHGIVARDAVRIPDNAPDAPLRGTPAAPNRGYVVPGPRDAPDVTSLAPAWLAPPAAEPERATPPPQSLPAASVSADHIVGQQLLLAAAFSHMQLAPAIAAYLAPAQPVIAPSPHPSHWSGDGWLLLRQDSSGPLVAGQPSYGRSQAGAVIRYRLAPASGHRPVAYARADRALVGPAETEMAVGFAARPMARVPLSVAVEVRAYDGPAGREVRPAAFAVTELPPAKLPLGLRGEAYVQAGYVGGRYATAFVDGQARVDADVARLGRDGELRAGGGAWGGAEKHAARLDVGPSATISFRLGDTRSRLALDYRFRVAGDAEPKSGAALTISAGF